MRLIEVIQRSSAFLESRGVESPRLQVELLLAHTLRVPRLQLYLQFERILDTPTLDTLRHAVRRRGQREPLQHILGSTSFCGIEIQVDSHVLIPRPETELLAEHAWTWLNRQTPNPSTPLHALDWGTGSGCIAIAIATRAPTTHVTALDISPAALDVAQRNATRSGVANRIQFVAADGTASLPADQRFDLIVSNPPYIPSAEIPQLQPEVRDHDPALALDGGPDGFTAYRRLATELPGRLRSGGVLMLEFGDDQGTELSRILSESGWNVLEIRPDYTGRNRLLVAQIAGS